MLLLIILVTVLLIILRLRSNYYKYKTPNHLLHLKTVPVVQGGLPFIGHGLQFSKDIVGFVQGCMEKYGNIFRVQIYRTDMIIVCDRQLVKEFFAKKEADFSLIYTLNRLFFGYGFGEDESFLGSIMTVVKTTIKVKFEDFIPKIEAEARKMIEIIKENGHKKVMLTDIMTKFVARTSASCFLCIDLTDEFYETLMKFAHILNKIVILTYFFPKWFLRLTVGKYLAIYRKKMISLLLPLFTEYRNDPEKKDSPIIRKAMDCKDPNTNQPLTDEQVGSIIVCLLYVSSENTALGLCAVITDLAINEKYWHKIRREAKAYLDNDDLRGFVKNAKVMDSCFKESSRMNTHIFPLNRYPINKDESLGQYYVGGTVSVGLCAPILMCKENNASTLYTNPEQYNPERFLKDNAPKSNTDIMTFGSGIHKCPGELFGTYEIKIAVALITNNFKPFKMENISELNYFSPSAFAERAIETEFEECNYEDYDDDSNKEEDDEGKFKICHNDKEWHAQMYEGGLLIKDFLERDEQIDYFKEAINLSSNTQEHDNIPNDPLHAYPITYHNLVYTGTSNCPEPTKFYDLAKDIWLIVNKYQHMTSFTKTEFKPNSLHCQLFGENCKMALHKDKYCDWGISLSLGASCDFTFGLNSITLNSGDLFIADFSKVDHGVTNIHDNLPGFMDEETGSGVQSFGMSRLSIQIRDINEEMFKRDDMLTIKEFEKIMVSY